MMKFETSVNYGVYELYPKQYVKPPNEIRCCPKCAGALSKSNIPPSKAVTSWLAAATMPYHNFSYLYDCPACHWWAVWESFGDAEYSPDFNYLIASRTDSNPVYLNNPWNQVLENENAYDYEGLLPKSLEEVLIGGKKRIPNLLKPGDKVRLVGDVHMLQDLELVPLFVEGSEGTVINDEELYVLVIEQTKPEIGKMKAWWQDLDVDTFIKGRFIRLKTTMEALNCCPIRLEKLVVSQGKRNGDLCKEGEIYLIYLADIRKID